MAAKSKGHIEHIQTALKAIGLPGDFPKPIKITFIGAGSSFTPSLLKDVLLSGIERGEMALVDIDKRRLSAMTKLIKKLLEQHNLPGWKLSAATDRRQALPGSDYIINCIEVDGLPCVDADYDIPAKYGVDQCIGDTIGPGGIFKGLRTVPAWLGILRDAEDLCPNALILNYTNPMSILCLAAARTSSMNVIGLCHSVQGTGRLLSERAGVPFEEMAWECSGINHLAWFLKLEHKGKDLYPLLKKKAKQDMEGKPSNPKDKGDLVRKDMMLNFGYFITESSGHLSEYLPYYRKRNALKRKYCRARYEGESRFYANNWPQWRADADKKRRDMLSGKKPMNWERTWEYASWIIEAKEKDSPFRVHGNVPNTTGGAGPLIANLSPDGCVEVACMVDRNGIHPTRPTALPAQCAAICESNMRVYDLAATAAIEKSREAATLALMLDPLTAAVCSPSEIRQMADDLFKAEKRFLKGYK
jgi:alpha-galactosidase